VFPESLDWEQELTKEDPDHAIALLPKCCDRVWLVLSHADAGQIRRQTSRSIETALTTQYPDVEEKEFRGVRVLLYTRRKVAGLGALQDWPKERRLLKEESNIPFNRDGWPSLTLAESSP
jgi:hypothetical protein